jgi:hypothetical protein
VGVADCLALLFLLGCPSGWWWGGDRSTIPVLGDALGTYGRWEHARDDPSMVTLAADLIEWSVLLFAALGTAIVVQLLARTVADLYLGDDPRCRWRRRDRAGVRPAPADAGSTD